VRRYLRLLRNRPFAALWAGSTISGIGDGLTTVSLIWIVYAISGSVPSVSVLVIVSTAPTLAGGFAMGALLDRVDRRRTLLAVNAVLGIAVGSVPLLHALGRLEVWNLYVVGALYGLLKMANFAGVPALLAAVVADADLNTANAMESIGFGLADVAGPALAGGLIGLVGGANVLALDAASYAVFLGFLLSLRIPPVHAGSGGAHAGGVGAGLRLIWAAAELRLTTLMFMAFNAGEGMLAVLAPVYARRVLGGGAGTYGLLLSGFAAALLAGSAVVGALDWRRDLFRSIAVAQALAGAALVGLLAPGGRGAALDAVGAAGLAASPLTIWAQTLRMRATPEPVRGRVFGAVRTLIQSTTPVGAALAGILVAAGSTRATILVMAALMAVPGLAALVTPRGRAGAAATLSCAGSPGSSG